MRLLDLLFIADFQPRETIIKFRGFKNIYKILKSKIIWAYYVRKWKKAIKKADKVPFGEIQSLVTTQYYIKEHWKSKGMQMSGCKFESFKDERKFK